MNNPRILASKCREYMTSNAKALHLRPAELALDAGKCLRRCPAGHLYRPHGGEAADQPCPRCGSEATT